MRSHPGSGPPSGDPASPAHSSVVAVLSHGEIHLSFPFDRDLLVRVRTLPGRRWDRRRRIWRVPDTAEARQAIRRELGVVPTAPTSTESGAPPPGGSGGEGLEATTKGLDATTTGDLLQRFDEEMRLRGYAPRTRKAYLGHARRFLPDGRAGGDLAGSLREHVLARLRGGGVSRSYHNQLVSAPRLFCATVLGRPPDELPLDRPRRDQRLPTVLSREELRRFLEAVGNPKHAAILALAYSAGLRVSEVVRLRPQDLDRDRGLLLVRGGKGRKDRYTLLSSTALGLIDAYLEGADPGRWLFPGARPGRYLTPRSVQKATAAARRRAGTTKPLTPHVLHHNAEFRIMPSGVVEGPSLAGFQPFLICSHHLSSA